MPRRSPRPLMAASLVPFVAAGLTFLPPSAGPDSESLPSIAFNDNLEPAGRLANRALTLSLEIRKGRWFLLGPDRPPGEVLAFAEAGSEPQIPGPLLRVPLGTTMRVRVTNSSDVTLVVRGLTSRHAAVLDSLLLGPGATGEARFTADAEGTFYYWASAPGVGIGDRAYDDSQLHGAFVVDGADAAGAPRDRVLVIGGWVQGRDAAGEPDVWNEIMTINGRPWPLTERFTYDLGDSVRWRLVNASIAPHPMHLHGFYYRVEARGDLQRDSLYWPAQQRMVVTELLWPGTTMTMAWSPDRPGGWVFHCHLNWHIVENAKVGAERETMPVRMGSVIGNHPDHDPQHHVETAMGGLMLGLYVRPPAGWRPDDRVHRTLRLFIQSDSAARDSVRRFGYVLQDGDREPAPDSVLVPGSPLVLQRGEPTRIQVHNRTSEPTQIHWHGMEIESPFDGVVGVGGMQDAPTPSIMPGDSFEVRVTPPRSGSFMYHTHVNDIRQMRGGLWAPLIVLEPGERWNPEWDRVFMVGEGRDFEPRLNGLDSLKPIALRAGEPYRFRLMNVAMGGPDLQFWLVKNGAPLRWTPLAADGRDLPAWQRAPTPARRSVTIGQTFDYEVVLPPGEAALEVRRLGGHLVARQVIQAAAIPTVEEQIAAAVLPLPDSMRAGATVLGYRQAGKLVELRKGTKGVICLADDPASPPFHVACYHESMEPFMARGRELRAGGVTGEQVDSVRFREVKEGKLPLPSHPASLFSLSGLPGSWDPKTNEVKEGRPLYVIYIPYATTETTGIPSIPAMGTPWLMFPGTPKAHIMFVPRM